LSGGAVGFARVRELCVRLMRFYPDLVPLDLRVVEVWDLAWENVFNSENGDNNLVSNLKEVMGVLEVLLKGGVLDGNENRDVRYEVDRMIENNDLHKTETKLNELKKKVEEQKSRGKGDKEIKNFLLREAKNYWVEGFIVTGGVSSIVDLVICSSPSPNIFQLCMKILHTFFVSSASSTEKKTKLFKFISQYIFSKCSFGVLLSSNSNIPDDLLIRLKFEKDGNEWRTRHNGNIMLFLKLTQYFINSTKGIQKKTEERIKEEERRKKR
jgi:hypothetical protein